MNSRDRANGKVLTKEDIRFDVEIKLDSWITDMVKSSRNFKKYERETIMIPFLKTMIQVSSNIARGRYIKSARLEAWKKAQADYYEMQKYLKLLYELDYISVGFFYVMDRRLSEIGKMISGLFKDL